ncbi:hypothetical protein TL99_004628, partial [Salmonella enterica subsp. enterica]|nr:hypothetical protein [Salmonella enterica subsp. enterica]
VEARRLPQAARAVTHREAGTTWRMSKKSGATARHPKKGEAGGYPPDLILTEAIFSAPLCRRITHLWHSRQASA